MMIATSFIVILGLAFSYGYSVPLSRVKISDNGLMGYILHNDEDNQKSGFVEGHNIFPRSFGSEFKIESDYMESDSKPTEDDNSEEVMIKSESRFGDYGAYPYGTGGFQSFLPFPPPHHGPNPGPYTPPFSKQQNAFPGVPGGGWDNNFGHGPCHGNGCGRGGHGHGHGFGNDHGYGQGHGGGHTFGHSTPPPFGHGNVYGHGNDHGYGHGFGYGQGNGQGHGFGHGQGHGYGHGYGHGHGHGYGHGHGHGNGNGKDFGGDDSSEENEQLHSTEKFPTPTPPIINVTPPVTPVVTVPVTSKPQTSAPITTEPTYDIDIRLGSSDDS